MSTCTDTRKVRATAGKFLTLRLGTETYGISIQSVREILGLTAITAVPNTPKFIKGVTNLRGRIIPLIDLRLKLGMETAEYTRQTCIVVVEVNGTHIDTTKRLATVAAASTRFWQLTVERNGRLIRSALRTG